MKIKFGDLEIEDSMTVSQLVRNLEVNSQFEIREVENVRLKR